MNFIVGLLIGILAMAFYCGCLQISSPYPQNNGYRKQKFEQFERREQRYEYADPAFLRKDN